MFQSNGERPNKKTKILSDGGCNVLLYSNYFKRQDFKCFCGSINPRPFLIIQTILSQQLIIFVSGDRTERLFFLAELEQIYLHMVL